MYVLISDPEVRSCKVAKSVFVLGPFYIKLTPRVWCDIGMIQLLMQGRGAVIPTGNLETCCCTENLTMQSKCILSQIKRLVFQLENNYIIHYMIGLPEVHNINDEKTMKGNVGWAEENCVALV